MPMGAHPVGARRLEIGGDVLTAAQGEEPLAELAAVERSSAALCHRRQRVRDTRATDARAGADRSGRAVVVGAGQVDHRAHRPGEDRGSGEALGRVLTRGLEHLGHRQPPESLVQREPAVDASGDGHAADVTGHRHDREAVGAHALGVGPRAGAPRGVEHRGRATLVMDDGEQVAAHAAHVLRRNREHRAGRDRGVGRAAPGPQHRDAGVAREMVDRTHHAGWRVTSDVHLRIVRVRRQPGR